MCDACSHMIGTLTHSMAYCLAWTVHCRMQVGSAAWLRQHDALERLNMQAHQSAQCRADEYIVEALVAQDRLSHLVHELLVAEVHSMLSLLPCVSAQHSQRPALHGKPASATGAAAPPAEGAAE